MIKWLKKLFGKSDKIAESKKSDSWHKISDMDMPSSEKIKHVKIVPLPLSDGQVIEAKRKTKRYKLKVVPQTKGAFEYDEAKSLIVYALAGSKEEALDVIAEKITGRRSLPQDSANNTAIAGRWYEGDMCSIEILSYEQARNIT